MTYPTFDNVAEADAICLSDDEINEISGAIAPLVVYGAVAVGSALFGATAGYYANRDRTPRRRR